MKIRAAAQLTGAGRHYRPCRLGQRAKPSKPAPASESAALAHQARTAPVPLPPPPVFGSFVVGATAPAACVAVALGTAVEAALGVAVDVRVAADVAVGVRVAVLFGDGVLVRVGVAVAVDVAVGVATCACALAILPVPSTMAASPASPSEIQVFFILADVFKCCLSSCARHTWPLRPTFTLEDETHMKPV